MYLYIDPVFFVLIRNEKWLPLQNISFNTFLFLSQTIYISC